MVAPQANGKWEAMQTNQTRCKWGADQHGDEHDQLLSNPPMCHPSNGDHGEEDD